MRAYLSFVSLLAACWSSSFLSQAQTALPLRKCETAPEVRKILDAKLNPNVLNKMKYPERYALQRQVLGDLIAKYPHELEPYETLRWDVAMGGTHEEYQAFLDQWVKMAKDHPDDPLALLLAGKALQGKNSPEAIRLLEEARTKAPEYPWPARELAWFYTNGKRADPVKAKENTEAYFALCPASASKDFYEKWLLQKDLPIVPKTIVALRTRLEKDTDSKRLEDYETLWSREFLVQQPKEFDALRAQIVQDLKRLETVNPKGDAEWRAFLISGYKQSGASMETLTSMEDSLIRDYPHSTQAERIVSGRWYKAHQEPEEQTDAAAWARYYKASEDATKGWMLDYPDDTMLQRSDLFSIVKEDDAVSEIDGIAALDLYLQSIKDYKHTGMMSYSEADSAEFLLDHGWQPSRALDILEQTKTVAGKGHADSDYGDNVSDDDLKRFKYWHDKEDQRTVGLLLKAALQAGKPEEAVKLKASMEEPPPSDKRLLSDYWYNRARYEALQHHTLDALTYYHLALDSRTETPKPYHGKLHDDLTYEAHVLWKAQGGTEAAWVVWSKPTSGTAVQLAESPWEKPKKAMPDFELSDFSGKTWRLKELRGKTVLISAWATWCGPCKAELPRLQNFYEKVKDRPDIQVLTFDIDENPGLVTPFLKEKGYTFPVLSAFSVEEVKGFIPQTWIIDAQGISRWTQGGFDDEKTAAEFEKDLLERLDTVKVSQ